MKLYGKENVLGNSRLDNAIDAKHSHERASIWDSLKFKIPLVSFIVAVLVASVISFTFYIQVNQILKHNAQQDLTESASFVSAIVHRYFVENIEDVTLLANANVVNQLVSVPNTLSASLRKQRQTQANKLFAALMNIKPKFSSIALLNKDNQMMAGQGKVSEAVTQQIATYYSTWQQAPKLTKTSYLLPNIQDERELSFLVLFEPIYRQQKHVANLIVSFELAYLGGLLSAFQKDGEQIFIVNEDDKVIYRDSQYSSSKGAAQQNIALDEVLNIVRQHNHRNAGAEQVIPLDSADSRSLKLAYSHQLVGDKHIQQPKLSLIFIHDEGRLSDAFGALGNQVILLGGILAFITLLLSIFAIRRFITPLTSMTGSIHHYEVTNELITLPITQKDETGQLARSFKRLFKHLEKQREHLNQVAQDANETSSKLQSILNSIADAVINFDEHGNILAFNRSAEVMFGYRAEEIIGTDFLQLLPHDSDDKYQAAIAESTKAHSEGRTVTGKELPAMRKDGEVFPMLLSVSKIITEQGILYTGLIRDNTYYKLLESERKAALRDAKELAWRLDFALSAPQIGVWEFNSVTGRVSWDKRMYRLYGYEKGDGVWPEQIWLKSLHPEDREQVDKAIEHSLATGEDFNITFRVMMPNKQVNYVESHAKAIFEQSGEIKRLVGTNRNITEQRLLHDLKQQALDIAQESLRMKSEFLASMSHEIRTPMNGVLGMLGLLEQSQLNKKQQHYLKLATSSAYSLLNLINDILDFSKVDAGKLELEILDFDLRYHLGEIAESMAIKAQEKGVELVLDVSQIDVAMVKSDPTRFRQILTNLIGNAIKFTDQGEVLIRAGLKQERKGLRFYCQVIDTGIGIEQEKLSDLFDSFTQVDASTTRRYGGTGLGLAIVKKLCQLMDGSVSVESEIGQGSKFSFNILMQTSDHLLVDVPETDFTDHKVLIVDDNTTSREVLIEQLSAWGASVSAASSGKEALALVAESNGEFEVAILDRQLADIDGVELGKQLKNSNQCQHMKLIMMTSMSERGDAEYFAKLGYSAYFPKPATVSDLHDAMAVVLSDKEQNSGQVTPIITPYNLHSAEHVSNEISLDKMQILLVEDNRVNQAVVQGILANAGSSADVAVNGVEAIAKLKSSDTPYDIVLMDCQMPEMDGYQATKEIRKGMAGVNNKHIPILAMTANAMKGDKEKCLAAGMNDYLSKPVDADMLCQKLIQWHNVSEQQKPVASPIEEIITTFDEQYNDEQVLWDKDSLRKRVRNNEQLVNNLVQLYLDETPQVYEQLLQTLSDHNWTEIIAHAHKLKGSTNNLGGLMLADIAAQIESAAKQQDDSQLASLHASLTSTYTQFISHLQAYLSQSIEA